MGGASQRSGSLAEKAARAVRRAAWPENAARRPCDKGFSGIGPSLSPLKCTGFRLIGGDGCPQCRALRPTGLARSPFDCTAFRVASGAGCPHPESACGALGQRRSPLKFTARQVGCGGGYPHGKSRVSSVRLSHSPFEYPGLRLAAVAVVHVRICIAS